MTSNSGIIAAAIITLSLPLAIHAQQPAIREQGSTATTRMSGTQAALEGSIPELMRKGRVPGLQIALIAKGETSWLGDFGVKDADSKQAVTSETVFEAGSLSKTVVAYGVLKLVERGKLKLDTPLTDYLPKPYLEGDERLKQITARLVLSHRTGFPNWRGEGNPLTIKFTPGERFSYSGEGFVYLQKVAEQITGKPLNEYMQKAVFGPLGMTSSSYIWRPDYDQRMASGHDTDELRQDILKPTEANGAASLHTTAHDYALFVEAILNGTGLKRETLQQMETPEIAVDSTCTNCTDHKPEQLSRELFWGLGWGIARTSKGPALWHWGDNGVFKCFVVAYPKQRNGVVLFTNSENGLGIAEDIVRTATGSNQPSFKWLHYDRYDSVAMQFAGAVHEKGVLAAVAEFHEVLAAGAVSEDSLNSLGYRLLSRKSNAEALEIFKLNVRLHPDSWNVYDSLGETYLAQGDKQLAIQNYEKSVELNPKNDGAVKVIQKLQAQ